MHVPVRRRTAAVVGGIAAALLLAACGSSTDSGGSSSSASAIPSSTNTDPACANYAQYGSYPAGTTVSLLTSILPPEQQQYEKSFALFEKCTGITVKYEGTNTFESLLPQRIKGGQPPDLAIIPQPGLLRKLVSNPDTTPLEAPASVVKNVEANWAPAFKQLGTVDGKFYAAPLSSNMKSLVWYSPKTFAAKGYTVPTTWDEMMKLSDKMVADGITPWCGGIGSGTATGWPATDWLEQVVLRQSGPEVYDKWTTHEIKFNSPEITKAMDMVASWMKNPKYVNGGFGNVQTIATTKFQDAGTYILPSKGAKCGMLQQASFYAAQWPSLDANAKVAKDGDIWAFFLPTMSSTWPTPIVAGGEFIAAYANRPEVVAFQTYLASGEWATIKVKLGGWTSANNKVPLDAYPDEITKYSIQLLTKPDATVRFDASDMMPAQVGSGAEWTQMTAWFATNKSTTDVLNAIDAAWPAS
jgi:alpha-glucoside transport system substrate-binding protein